jgi:hypothetical protein
MYIRRINLVIKKLPGETEFPAEEKAVYQPKTKQNFILVVFIGGITFAEISAIRYLNKRPNSDHKFIILTTNIINGKSMINSLRVNFDQVLSYKEFNTQFRQFQN